MLSRRNFLHACIFGIGNFSTKCTLSLPYKHTLSVSEYGAVGDGTTDDTVAIQNAINSGYKLQFEANKKYKITSPLILKHGTKMGKTYNNLIDFNYCEIIPHFSDDYAIKIVSVGDVNIGHTNIAYFDLRNLTINLGASTTAKAIKIGDWEQFIDSFHYSTITNFLILHSVGERRTVTTIENVRHVRFVGMVHRDCGVEVLARRGKSFCGDLEFKTCEFAGNGKSRPLVLRAGDNAVNTESEVRGITFDNCDIYGSETLIESIKFGAVGDIWFDKVQFDAPPLSKKGDSALIIKASNKSRIYQLHFSNNYFVGYEGAAIILSLINDPTILQVEFTSCHFNNITNRSALSGKAAIYANAFQALAFNNCEFADIIADSIFNFQNVEQFKILGCKTSRCHQTKYLATLHGDSKNFIIANNIADVSQQVVYRDSSTQISKNFIIKDNVLFKIN